MDNGWPPLTLGFALRISSRKTERYCIFIQAPDNSYASTKNIWRMKDYLV